MILELGAASLAAVVAMEIVERARRRCPECNRRFFRRVSMRCYQGVRRDPATGDWVRVPGALAKYWCKHCGAVRLEQGASGYLTEAQFAEWSTGFTSGAELWDASAGRPQARVRD